MNKELEGKIVDIMVKSNSLDEAASGIAALMPEPLAVIAARMDYNFVAVFPPLFGTRKEWVIELDDDRCVKAIVEFKAPTYEQAESLAREYLEKMEDVKK